MQLILNDDLQSWFNVHAFELGIFYSYYLDISSGNMCYEGTKEVSVLSIQHPRFYVFK